MRRIPPAGEKGFILITSFMLMAALTSTVGAMLFMGTSQIREMGVLREDAKLLGLAEAGVERAIREIRNDYQTSTQTGTATVRGATVSETGSVGSQDNIRYEEDGNASINCTYGSGGCTDAALLSGFDANYTGSRITSVLLCARASRDTGGSGATLEVSYATDNVFPNANTKLTVALPNSTTPANYSQDITADRTWSWSIIQNSNFTLRAIRTAGDRDLRLDMLYLTVTYEIDTNTEPWATGSYQSYPLSLGEGSVESVSITAERGKVHLNTASQTLLRYLMVEHGTADGTASTVATAIVNYRDTNSFDTVEELQRVTGMTSTIYDAIKDDVTVYSFINTNARRPDASRAPVNVNTASREVLEAVFSGISLGSSDPASLATDIIAARAAAPFTCFYSLDAAVTTDFYDFVMGRSYLSTTGNPDEKDRVLDNADASELVPVEGHNDYDGVTTEFCYDTNAFLVEAVSDIGGRDFRVRMVAGDTGVSTFTTYDGDTSSVGYWRESFS